MNTGGIESFADIPAEIRRRVVAGERVALVVLDALGLEFLARCEDHPVVERLAVLPLRSQFPSTTTAHVTTLHFGMPVTEHGLYEWHVLEPSLGAVICPLRFDRAEILSPGPTFYETLGASAVVCHPEWIAGSSYTDMATRGAAAESFKTLAEGLRSLARRFARDGDLRYAMVYWDRIDDAGHAFGPDSAEYDHEARAALDAIGEELASFAGISVLVTADHGQARVSPGRVDYLDDVWPALTGQLSQAQPAGSSRDVFLHVADGSVDAVIEGLSSRLDDRAQVLRATDAFDAVGSRLRDRLGDVVVLPSEGRQAWLRGSPGNEQWFLGQHGGLSQAETSTYLAEISR